MTPTDPTRDFRPDPNGPTADAPPASGPDAGLAAAFGPDDTAGAAAAPADRDAPAGAILAGRDTLVEAIGEGGTGSVYLARQTEPVRRVGPVPTDRRRPRRSGSELSAPRRAPQAGPHPVGFPSEVKHRRHRLSDGTEVALRPTDGDPSTVKRLREFLTAAIPVAGHESAPLLPPITHTGDEIGRVESRAGGARLLTLGADGTARPWDTRTGGRVADLRAAREQVVDCGFSPDGRTAVTDDTNMTVRLWDPRTGACRAQTEPFNRRGRLPKATHVTRSASVSDTRLLTRTLSYDERGGNS